jgi:hypothetical protein
MVCFIALKHKLRNNTLHETINLGTPESPKNVNLGKTTDPKSNSEAYQGMKNAQK